MKIIFPFTPRNNFAMGADIMNANIARQLLLKEVQEEFSKHYPYLKIDFTRGRGENRSIVVPSTEKMAATGPGPETDEVETARLRAQKLLREEFTLSDNMKIYELEVLLQYEFGLPAQILRKSGNLWLETRMTQHWTLRQQNDHGLDIAQGFI